MAGVFSSWWEQLTGRPSASSGSSVVCIRPDKQEMEITELLRHAPLMRIACEVMAEDIARAWRVHTLQPDAWTDIEELYEFRDVAELALFYAEGYGGAFVHPRFSETVASAAALARPRPRIREGLLGFSVYPQQHLSVANHTEGQRQANGLPVYYSLTGLPDVKIHHSWFFPVKGPKKLPIVNEMTFNKPILGQSRVDIIYDDFSRMINAYSALSHILVKGNIDVLKVKGLAEAISRCDTTEEMQVELQKLIMQASSTVTGANTFQPMVIDSEEELERKAGNHTGAADMVLVLRGAFAAAAQIPLTRLFGEQAKGINNGGEADLTSYYDRCASHRERRLTGLLNWMDSIAAPGKRTKWDYAPLWLMSEATRATVQKDRAAMDKIYSELGLPGIEAAIVAHLRDSATYTFAATQDPQNAPSN